MVPTTAVIRSGGLLGKIYCPIDGPCKMGAQRYKTKMVADGRHMFTEVGPGKVLQSLVKKQLYSPCC